MNFWNAFPFVRYSLALILGILLSSRLSIVWENPFLSFLILIIPVLFTAFFFRKKSPVLLRTLSGFFTLALIVYLGGYLAVLNDDRIHSDHYQNIDSKVLAFSGTISSDHYERENYFRYDFDLENILTEEGKKTVNGKIFLYLKKDSAMSPVPYGAQLYIQGNYFGISGPKNPDEFNYQQYLAHKNIYAQAFVETGEWEIVGHASSNFLMSLAYWVRTRSSEMISAFIPGAQESAVINALLIGVKDYLDTEIREAYSAAGAMHVLAVSGLHVGIVYLLITIVFGSLKKIGWGRVCFVLISLAVIWCYALITGFSPSVMRASTMFSVIILGESSKRKSNIYNSLGLAAFILLLYNPYFVYEVGFQLSFVAVLGIVMFQPPIYRLVDSPNKFLDYLWAIVSVSIAAQLATFPLSLYYFNQFPTYFLLSNILIIPASMVMLSTGLFMLCVGSFSVIAGETIGFLLGGFVEFINWLIISFQLLPMPTIDWLYLSAVSVVLIYFSMLYFFQGVRNSKFPALVFAMVCLTLLIVNFHYEDLKNVDQERIVIFHTEDDLIIDVIVGRESRLISFNPDGISDDAASFSINPHHLVSGLPKVEQIPKQGNLSMKNGIYFDVIRGLKVLIVSPDASGVFDDKVSTDLVVYRKLNIPLMEKINARYVIVGPMESWRERMNMISHLKGVNEDFFDLIEDGAFELDLKNYPLNNQASIFVR